MRNSLDIIGNPNPVTNDKPSIRSRRLSEFGKTTCSKFL
jgi:hypothetical protein